ncbi:MAG: MBL fold metallo-hydrolase [Rhodoferax sp.]|uniref:MBL fold metallo-hydrolase n=1 Tax=Rhodoferax sp. TaxID=50421 RepID=UPI003265C3EA
MTPFSTAARWALTAVAAATLAAPALAAGPLKLEVYNPGHDAIFPVSSVLVTGDKDAVLIDAQFGASQAAKVVEKIRASGKNLTTIYISHGDPDYYFGLETVHAAFPNAKIVATPQTVEHIKESAAGKLAYWGPILKTDAPSATLLPEVLQGHTLTLEGKKLEIKGDAQPDRSFVWIPSLQAVVGGIPLANNLHVWMADTQTPASHTGWLATLAQIQKLKPKVVVPGHYLEGPSSSLNAAKYTADYIKAFDKHTATAKDSAELIEAMKKEFPAAGEVSSLELSAKVAKGEMKW